MIKKISSYLTLVLALSFILSISYALDGPTPTDCGGPTPCQNDGPTPTPTPTPTPGDTELTCIDDTFLGIIGSATPGGFSSDTDMQSCGNDIYFLSGVNLISGVLKFRTNNSWIVNYGDYEPDGILDLSGDDIVVPTGGTYDILANLATGEYSVTLQ